MQSQNSRSNELKLPFILNFIEPIEPSVIEDAMLQSELLADSYNPETQTSRISVYAGTHLTYDSTFSGALVSSKDDARESDG
jgi:hypothetical protein